MLTVIENDLLRTGWRVSWESRFVDRVYYDCWLKWWCLVKTSTSFISRCAACVMLVRIGGGGGGGMFVLVKKEKSKKSHVCIMSHASGMPPDGQALHPVKRRNWMFVGITMLTMKKHSKSYVLSLNVVLSTMVWQYTYGSFWKNCSRSQKEMFQRTLFKCTGTLCGLNFTRSFNYQ